MAVLKKSPKLRMVTIKNRQSRKIRKLKMISTVFLMAAVVPVVPGLGLYRMMACFGQGQTSLGADYGIQAMITIAMTALGLAMGSFVDRSLHRQKTHPVVS